MPQTGKAPISPEGSLMERPDAVRVAGRGSKVDFLLDQHLPVHLLEAELRTFLRRSNGWFAGGEVTVYVGVRALRPDELGRLRAVLEDEHSLKVSCFRGWAGDLETTLSEQVGVPVQLTATDRAGQPELALQPVPQQVPQPQETTYFFKGNCRSGVLIQHPGDVVVFGDVNPGGQVIAEGNVVVLGVLRGSVHAGTKDSGRSDASIVAFDLKASQLRIGPHLYARPPGNTRGRKRQGPEIAYVQGHSIVVGPFTGRFKSKQERNLT